MLALTACSQGSAPASDTPTKTAEATSQATDKTVPEYDFMLMEKFDANMGEFIGLVEGESFDQSKPKIDAVFRSYEGHEAPVDIQIKKSIVEAGWTEVIVTQDGLMDGTVAGQQLLAIYDDDDQLVTYGVRIKCHTKSGTSDWQNTVCG